MLTEGQPKKGCFEQIAAGFAVSYHPAQSLQRTDGINQPRNIKEVGQFLQGVLFGFGQNQNRAVGPCCLQDHQVTKQFHQRIAHRRRRLAAFNQARCLLKHPGPAMGGNLPG